MSKPQTLKLSKLYTNTSWLSQQYSPIKASLAMPTIKLYNRQIYHTKFNLALNTLGNFTSNKQTGHNLILISRQYQLRNYNYIKSTIGRYKPAYRTTIAINNRNSR